MKFAIFCAAMLCAAPAMAQTPEPDYLDDRSDATSLIRSLYNAINRHEYARAYSYFSDPPADSVDAYADGYSDTQHVELATGAVASEGAAGSEYFHVPVAIEAQKEGGAFKVYAGCYVVRMINPGIQAEDYKPLLIESGKLAPSDKTLQDAVPASCPDAPPVEGWDPDLQKARAEFKAVYGDTCNMTPPEPDLAKPDVYDIEYSYSYDTDADPKHHVKLYRFWCMYGAYNEIHVYFQTDEFGEEVQPVAFAEPSLDVRYVDDDADKAVKDITIIGFQTLHQLVNSSYDPDTKTLTTYEKWRGLADAFSVGTWIFREGRFDLVKYEVDASYDGKQTPETVLDYLSGP